MIDWIKTHPKETILIVTVLSATVIAVYCFGYEHGSNSLPSPSPELIKVKELTVELSDAADLITAMQTALGNTAVELTQAKEKYILR